MVYWSGDRKTGREEGSTMAFTAILREVDRLNEVSARLELLADRHPVMSDALVTIAGNVRTTATVLAVLVTTKGPGPI